MAGERAVEPSTGQIACGNIEPGALVLQTISFVRQQLPTWRDDVERKAVLAENEINSQVCDFLDTRARNDFPMVHFKPEPRQSGRRRADLAAKPTRSIVIGAHDYTIYDPILVFEGKRLPAPSKEREKEYVTGYDRKNGGIQRFKLGLHGAELDVAAMIGYVQERLPQEWHVTINEWISDLACGKDKDDCNWSADEILGTLKADAGNGMASCFSFHSRTGGVLSNRIRLHHLWIEMNLGQAQEADR